MDNDAANEAVDKALYWDVYWSLSSKCQTGNAWYDVGFGVFVAVCRPTLVPRDVVDSHTDQPHPALQDVLRPSGADGEEGTEV